MNWYLSSLPFSDAIKKNVVKFFVERYLDHFLEEKLRLDQLTVDLYNGIGTVRDVALDVQVLNEWTERLKIPIEFVVGHIENVKVYVPWSTILTDPSSVDVEGLSLTVQPKQRAEDGASMFESMWSSMTSSMLLAEECLKYNSEQISTEQTSLMQGVEEFARTIDSILTRVKLQFVDTVIRLENLPKNKVVGGAIEIRIKQFSYCDETCDELVDDHPKKPSTAYGVKLFSAEGVELYTSEFHASNRTVSKTVLLESAQPSSSSKKEMKEKRNRRSEDLILFGKFFGKQEVRLKVKQKENASGPKTDFELNISTLAMFASPRQLRVVGEIMSGFVTPHLQDTSNVKHRPRNQKPMTTSDFERVEQELNQALNPSNAHNFVPKSLQNTAGWSSGGVDEESDDEFHPVRGHPTYSMISDSASNSVSSSYISPSSSYHFSSKSSEQFAYAQARSHTTRHKHKSSGSESDLNGDTTKFEIRLNFVTAVLLHRDILVTRDETRTPEESSVQEMQALSNTFFSHFTQSSGHQPNITLENNHFRLRCSTLVLKGDRKSNSSNCELKGSLSVASLELLEQLMEMDNGTAEIIELIRFLNPRASDTSSSTSFTSPDLAVDFKYCDETKRFSTHTRTQLNVEMQPFSTEIDVTMIDRLVDITNNVCLLRAALNKAMDVTKPTLSDVHAPGVDSKFDWKMSSPFVRVKLRFPIPEMREPVGEDEYWFWHRRNLHKDLLFVELSEMSVQSQIATHQMAQSYEFRAKSARVLFQEAHTEKPIPFIHTLSDEKLGASLPDGGKGFDWPRLVMRVYPKVNYVELEEIEEQRLDPSASMAQSIIQTRKQEPSPFSAKLIKRESDTSHSSDSTSNCDGEEIILPGNKEEIGEFVEAASHNALLQFDITLPSAVVLIPTKQFYELLYNRFSNDLMLWVPETFKQSFSSSGGLQGGSVNLNFGCDSSSMFPNFSMCHSTVKTDSDSDEEDAGENLLDRSVEKNAQNKDTNFNDLQQSKITVSLHVGQGVIDIFPHARDSKGNVIPGQYGEVQLMFQEANLFLVSGYKGEPLLNFVCLQINECSLYHCSLVPEKIGTTLKRIEEYPSKHVLPTIYQTSPGARIKENAPPVGTGSTISEDMLTLSVRVQAQENRVKNICVANSLKGATIRYRMKATYTNWLSHLTDFFDIKDYPISNYQPYKVVTELNQQLANVVIDYRPLHLPQRAALTIENFNISSNITSKTATSILRFIAEEASLFISCKVSEVRDDPHDLSINLRSDYVSVVEVGLFELSLRLTDNEGEPQTDLRASNNIVHIRTCADSAIALVDLIKYIAIYGDLTDEQYEEYRMTRSDGSEDDILVNLQSGVADANSDKPYMGTPAHPSEMEVSQLVEDAMKEEPYTGPPRKRSNQARMNRDGVVELFYFPNDEGLMVGHFSDSLSSDDDFESSFCYVDREVGMGFLPSGSSAPEIRMLTKEPIHMVDNHFSVPINTVDVLKAPKGYPLPVSKYTLREMTIVWHMYGGNDFPKDGEEEAKPKKRVVIASEKPASSESLHSFDSGRTVKRASGDSINVKYSAGKSAELPTVDFLSSSSPRPRYNDFMSLDKGALHDMHKNRSWQVAGGVNRQLDTSMELKLHKLKYRYELYPETTKQASRQVLVAHEVEIIDRMASSQINKFLYQHSSSARPRLSHANMIVVKITQIRPDLDVSHRLESCVRASVQPLRLNIDQNSLIFLINFGLEISGNKREDDASLVDVPQQPVLNVDNRKSSTSSADVNAEKRAHSSSSAAPASTPTFIRSFIFSPDVPIRLDYTGQNMDFTYGPVAGVLMGLGQLNCSELKLKKLFNRHGFLGVEKLLAYMFSEWSQDIKKQLPSILGGVGPMYSLVQLFQGIRDLFWLPIEQYQKDGRIVRGLQRGANSFTTSTAMAALELTARLVYAIQLIAETAFDLVSPGPSIRNWRYDRNDFRKGGRRYPRNRRRPGDFREGCSSALQLFKHGMEDTAHNIIRAACNENETKGAVGAVGGIIREMPSAALKPIILATQATSNVLDGVRSHLVPDAKTEAALKWKTDYFK